MPHLVLHYSANLKGPADFAATFRALHERLSAVAGTSISNFKSRAQRQDDAVVGDGAATNAFVHLDVAVLARPQKERAAIAEAALDVLKTNLMSSLDDLDTHVTVHVSELDPEVYRKAVIARAKAAAA